MRRDLNGRGPWLNLKCADLPKHIPVISSDECGVLVGDRPLRFKARAG
jgi:hypothetical protein